MCRASRRAVGDTNGCFPQVLRSLVEESLVDFVAMDVKNSPERYAAFANSGFFTIIREEGSGDTREETLARLARHFKFA